MGIVADTAAVVLPGIPGGAGVAINAARITGAAANIAGGALSIQDGLENSDYLEAGIGAVQAASGVGQEKFILEEQVEKVIHFQISQKGIRIIT